jgi:hypothetical protein
MNNNNRQGFFDNLANVSNGPSIQSQKDDAGMFHEAVIPDVENAVRIDGHNTSNVDANEQFENHERGDNTFVIVSKEGSSLDKGYGASLLLYSKRYVYSLFLVFVFAGILQLILFVFNSNTSRPILNLYVLILLLLEQLGSINFQ